MSQTTTVPPVTAPVTVATRGAPESLQSQTFLVSLGLMLILAGTLMGVFLIKDMSPLQGTIAGSVVGGILGGLCGYYFASSKHGPATDTTPTTTTVSAPPATITTTTGPVTPVQGPAV